MTLLAEDRSELHAEFLSTNSYDPWVDVNSGPRKVMMAGHLAQALTISGSEERYWQTGTEKRFGEHTFAIKAPADITIHKIIKRYPSARTGGNKMRNPQTIVVYVEIESRKVGILDFGDFNLEHQYFGFKYVTTEAYHRIAPGADFPKDTPFLISPSIKPGGGHATGVNLMFATMSHLAVAEDAMMISRSGLKKMSYDVIETRTNSWGQNRFAKNIFGTHDRVKVMQDVGEWIRPDGLLMVTTDYDEESPITSMGLWDTMMIDSTYDEKLYTRAGEGKVIDIMVYHDSRSLPNGMNEQIEGYRKLTDDFYLEIMKTYQELQRRYGNKMVMSDEWHRLVLEAAAMSEYKLDEVVQLLFHKAPIDDYRVDIKVHYHITPTIGNKATGYAGDKGIICTVVDDHEMPTNEHGVRVDVLMSPESPVNRQNYGGMYEPFFNQVTREFLVTVRGTIRLTPDEQPTKDEVLTHMDTKPVEYNQVWEDLVRLYGILSPVMYEEYSSSTYNDPKLRASHLAGLFKFPCIHILSPTHRMTPWRAAVEECMKQFPPRITPVWYRGYSGRMVKTELPIQMGHKYFMLLEKTSDDYIAVSSAKIQHLQVLGQVTSGDKHSMPVKSQAVKAVSEAELRIIMSYCGGEVAANLMDQNNSLASHAAIVYAVLDSKTPTNIDRAIDRKKIPLGGNRALKLFKHILDTNGFKFVYTRYKDPDIHRRNEFIDKDREVFFDSSPIERISRAVKNAGRSAAKYIRNLFNKED